MEIENTETQVEGAPNSNRTIMLLGNYVFPSPPSMTQLAEMKAAFRGVDTDNDGKVIITIKERDDMINYYSFCRSRMLST